MVEKEDSDDEEKINYISFNQDNSCFCIGTGKGFKVFTSYPFKKLFEREYGPIGIIEMLYRSNLLIIVKAAKKAPFLEEKMIIYDDHGNKSVGELTFKAPIRAIKVTKQ